MGRFRFHSLHGPSPPVLYERRPYSPCKSLRRIVWCGIQRNEGGKGWNKRAPQNTSRPLVTAVCSVNRIVSTKRSFSLPSVTGGCPWKGYATLLLRPACTIFSST